MPAVCPWCVQPPGGSGLAYRLRRPTAGSPVILGRLWQSGGAAVSRTPSDRQSGGHRVCRETHGGRRMAKKSASESSKQFALQVVRRLAKAYPHAWCTLEHRTPLDLLIATILAAQCTDQRVNQVTKELFTRYRTAADYLAVPIEELKLQVQSTGFYNAKTRSIRQCCQALVERHGGQVPKQLEQLTQLPGVGRKTANVVLGTAYGIASGIVVDTHVTRVSQRLGLTSHKQPDKIEADLMAVVPRNQWIVLGHRMIAHGRHCCTARNPKCAQCPLGVICPRIGVKDRT